MTHEEFVRLAGEAARNAQGLRSLAGHVRRLYGAIRALQEDDNSLWYIAEVIQEARGDKREAFQFMTRVKTYHNRDREAVGDAPVQRGMKRCAQLSAPEPAGSELTSAAMPVPDRSGLSSAENAPTSATEPPGKPGSDMVPDRAQVETPRRVAPAVPVAGEGLPAPAAPRDGKNESREDLGALTAALHNRPGHRRVVSGG